MTDQSDQLVRDQWQLQLYESVHQLSVELKKLHETNPWPNDQVLPLAMNALATELWDRCFSQTEIRTAFNEAFGDLPRYAGGDEVRP